MQNDYLPKRAWAQLHQNDVSLLKELQLYTRIYWLHNKKVVKRSDCVHNMSRLRHIPVLGLMLEHTYCAEAHLVPTTPRPRMCTTLEWVQSTYACQSNLWGLRSSTASAPLHWLTVFLVLIVSEFKRFMKTSAMRGSHGSDRILMGRVNQGELKESRPLPALRPLPHSAEHTLAYCCVRKLVERSASPWCWLCPATEALQDRRATQKQTV